MLEAEKVRELTPIEKLTEAIKGLKNEATLIPVVDDVADIEILDNEHHTNNSSLVSVDIDFYGHLLDCDTRVDVLVDLVKDFSKRDCEAIPCSILRVVLGMNSYETAKCNDPYEDDMK